MLPPTLPLYLTHRCLIVHQTMSPTAARTGLAPSTPVELLKKTLTPELKAMRKMNYLNSLRVLSTHPALAIRTQPNCPTTQVLSPLAKQPELLPGLPITFKSNHYNSPLNSAPPNSRSGSRGAAPPVPPRAAGSGYWPPKTANSAASFSRAPGAEIRETIGARPSFNQTPLSVNSRGFPVAPPFFLSILLSIRDPFWQEYVARPLSAARAFTRALDEDPSRPFLHVQGERYLPSLNKVFRRCSRTLTC